MSNPCYSRSASSSPVLTTDSSPAFSCFTVDDGDTDAEMAELDLDDEQKLAEAFEPQTKYRETCSPPKQVRFSTSPSFCDPFSASANSTRHPPRYAKKESSPNRVSESTRRHEVKMKPLPLPIQVDMSGPQVQMADPESQLWEATISTAIDLAEGSIDLSTRNLTFIPPSIGHLAHLVTLPTQAPTPPMPKRDFARTSTAPAITTNPRVDRRKFDAIKSTMNLAIPTSKPNDRSQLHIFLGNNQISSIPFELCSLKNLVVLSLRSNSLTQLPPCISYLTSLQDLNIANNDLEYLPSEITKLSLRTLSIHPNPFYPCPPIPETGRCTGELVMNHIAVVSMRELAIRQLIKPLNPDGDRSTLESLYALPLPSSEATGITEELSVILSPTSSGLRNPYHQVCPSPHHKRNREPTPYFVEPMLERLEWIDKIGEVLISAPRVPIKWRGCSMGCLNFLEEDGVEMALELPAHATSNFLGGTGPRDESFEFSDEEDE